MGERAGGAYLVMASHVVGLIWSAKVWSEARKAANWEASSVRCCNALMSLRDADVGVGH